MRPPALRPQALATLSFLGGLVFLFTVSIFRHHWTDRGDPYKCHALRNHGRWSDYVDRERGYRTSLEHGWTPPGCILHRYKGVLDLARCSRHKSLLLTFIGDISVFQIYKATLNKTIEESAEFPNIDATWENPPQSHDWHSEDGRIRLQFVWDPLLNSSQLSTSLGKLRQDINGTESWMVNNDPLSIPDGILIGGGLWMARHLENPDRHYTNQTNSILSNLTHISPGKVFILPILEPIYDRLSPSRRQWISSSIINKMHETLAHKVKWVNPPPILWSFTAMTAGQPESYGESGIHVLQGVAHAMSDVFLNLVCNGRVIFDDGYPFDRTCCVNYKPFGFLRFLTTIVLIVLGVVVHRGWSGFHRHKVRQLSFGVLVMLAAAHICFFADRTQFVDKGSKTFQPADLNLLISGVAVFLISSFGWQTMTRQLSKKKLPDADPEAHVFIPRTLHQKLKGLAVTFQFLFEYIGLSEADMPFLFQASRTVTATYFFLLGYGHAIRYVRDRHGWKDTVRLLLRLNLFRMLLTHFLDRPFVSWQPLFNFWYIVIYILFNVRIWDKRITFPPFWKMFLAFCTTGALCSQGSLEYLSQMPPWLFSMTRHGTIEFWQERFIISWGAVHAGLLAAGINLWMMNPQVFASPPGRIVVLPQAPPPKPPQLKVRHASWRMALAFLFNYFYWWTTLDSSSPSLSTSQTRLLLSAFAWVPLLPILVMRNWLDVFRFDLFPQLEWLGRLTLWLTMLWQHLLLAGDGHGVLRTGVYRGGSGHVWTDTMWDLLILIPVVLAIAWALEESFQQMIAALTEDPLASAEQTETELTTTEAARKRRDTIQVPAEPV